MRTENETSRDIFRNVLKLFYTKFENGCVPVLPYYVRFDHKGPNVDVSFRDAAV